MIDLNNLKVLSVKSEIDEFTVLREYLQIAFLDKFYKNKDLRKTYFKGGTSIKIFLGSSRFSEDLDFTTELSLPTLEKIVFSTVRSLKNEFPNISIKNLKTIQGKSFKLYFPNEVSKQPLTIKLDFSQRENVLDPAISPIETELPVMTTSLVNHLSAKEILAEKIRAIFTRKKGRDLFDLWFLLSRKIPLDINFINKKFDYYENEKFSIERLKEIIDSWREKEIDQDLRKFLPQSQRKIIGELKRLIISKLNNKD